MKKNIYIASKKTSFLNVFWRWPFSRKCCKCFANSTDLRDVKYIFVF